MKDLKKSHEVDNGIKAGGVILPDSVLESTRSTKPTYTGDRLTSLEFYNSLTQINANRILKCDYSYTGDNISGQVNTYYETDGVTAHQVETLTYAYTGDLITDIEVV